MRRRRQRVRLDIVVGVAQIVGHEAHDGEEHHENHRQGEEILDDVIGPEGNRVFRGLFLGATAHLDPGGVVVAGGVEGPDMDDDQRRDDEGQQIVQREEAVQRRVVDRRAAQQPGLDRFADARDRAEKAGDHGRAPEGHLAPGQNVAHERRAHHAQIDQHADDPGHFARGLVAAVVEAAEDVDVDGKEEQRGAVRMQVTQHVAAVHVPHDVFDAGECQAGMRGVVHDQHDAGRNLQHKAECQHDAPDPPPVQVLGGRDHQCVIDQADDRQAAMQPALERGLGLVMVVGNSGHLRLLSPA